MIDLDGYVSNTTAANANQYFFCPDDPEEVHTGLVFYKISKPGRYKYVFLYSSVLESTFGDGSKSKCNDVCDFRIHSLKVCFCKAPVPKDISFTDVSFSCKASVDLSNGITVLSDEIELTAGEGDYICLLTQFSGRKIAYHEETINSVYCFEDNAFALCPKCPVPLFTGIKREVDKRIGFIGDSITQGCGTGRDAYAYYSSYVAGFLGHDRYAFWNLGIGYARGYDAAQNGLWLELAKNNDIVCMCFGVNDILQGYSSEEIKESLSSIMRFLKERGLTVILQTIPPFDYSEEYKAIWLEVNEYIRCSLSGLADTVFDTTEFLGKNGKDDPASAYGPHPNGEGHYLWSQRLLPVLFDSLR